MMPRARAKKAAGRPNGLSVFNPTVQLLRTATAEAQRSRLPQMAAALSYRTVFGLIPVMVVALVAMKLFFTTDAEIAAVLNQGLRYSGLSSIAAPEPQMGPFMEHELPPPKEATPEEVAKSATEGESAVPTPKETAEANARLDAWIKDLVSRVSGVNFQAIGLIGAIALLYAALSMLVEVERAFNQIYRVPVGRSWMRRFVNYWALLCFGGIGLFLSFVVTNWFTKEIGRVAAGVGVDSSGAIFVGAVGYLSTVTISTALFLLVYMVVPNTRVKVGPALAGAVIAALIWEAGKWGFTQYLRYFRGYATLYGSIALVPLFLMWVYLTWCVVLFGLNVAYFLQHGRHNTIPEPEELPAPAIVDPASTLALMAALARRFESGQAADAAALSAQLALQEPVVAQMLERLAEAGFVNRVRQGDKEGCFALSRPPERVDAEAVVRLGEELLGPSADVKNPVVDAMHQARTGMVRGRTLASFLDGPAKASSKSPTDSTPVGADTPLELVIPEVKADKPAPTSRGNGQPRPATPPRSQGPIQPPGEPERSPRSGGDRPG